MLSPDDLLHISEGAEEIAEKLHSDIVRRIVNRIMLRIGRGEDYLLTATDKWQIENLQSAGYLLEDIQQDIAKATKLQQTEIAEAMEDAGVKALDYDDKTDLINLISSLNLEDRLSETKNIYLSVPVETHKYWKTEMFK